MNHQRHNNIRIGLVCVQRGTSTSTKIRIVQKNRSDEIRIRICQLIPKKPEIVRIYFGANSLSRPTVDRCQRLVPQGLDSQLAPQRMSGTSSSSQDAAEPPVFLDVTDGVQQPHKTRDPTVL